MAYGTIKVDTITFTDAGIDKSVTISGLVQNPTFTGNVTVTGTVSGATANFVSGVFTTQISGATVTGGNANFTSGTFTNISGGVYTITSGVFALGTSGTPSISFASDPNTGIYSPGADQVAISTNGTGRLFVDATGRILAGYTSGRGATATQHIYGIPTGTSYFEIRNESTSGTGDILFSDGTAGNYGIVGYDHSTDAFRVFTASSERLRVDSSGRLGLGTSAPRDLCEVNAQAATGYVRISGLTTTTDGFYGGIAFTNNAYTTARDAAIEAIHGSGAATTALVFKTQNTINVLTEQVRIDQLGRVGIGTTSPGEKLTVVGADNSANFRVKGSSSSGDFFIYNNASTNQVALSTNLTTTDMAFAIGGNEAMKIDTGKRLLVGTSSQSGGSLLQVNDNRIRIATAKTPASATDTGVAGEICWDANYVYVCTATNTWKRTAIATW